MPPRAATDASPNGSVVTRRAASPSPPPAARSRSPRSPARSPPSDGPPPPARCSSNSQGIHPKPGARDVNALDIGKACPAGQQPSFRRVLQNLAEAGIGGRDGGSPAREDRLRHRERPESPIG